MASWRPPDALERPVERREQVFVDPRPPKREKASRKGWQAIHARFEHAVCTHCAMRPVELHHVVSRSQGGDDVAENLCPLCRSCHGILESHAPGWERVAASVRPYVLLNRGRCVYVIGKIGWDRFNARYPMLSEPDEGKGARSAPRTPAASGSESDWEADHERYEGPTWRFRPPEDALQKSWHEMETG